MSIYTSIDASFSGTTCVTVLVMGSHVVCANVGDSRAIIGSVKEGNFKSEWEAKPLSKDHKLSDPIER
jgi:serine/threonine protein phosphatase PrpC